MEFALALRQLWRRRIWLVPAAIVSILAALAVVYNTSLFPPALKSKSFEYGAASAQVLVQPVQPAALAEVTASSTVPSGQVALYAALLQSQPLRRAIGRDARIPWPSLAVEGQASTEPGASQRSSQLVTAGRTLSLFYSVEPGTPIISLYAQAPEAGTAERVVGAAARSLQTYVEDLQKRSNTPHSQQMRILSLGKAESGTLASGAGKSIGVLVALLVFLACCLLIVFIPRFVVALRRAGAAEDGWGSVPVSMVPPPEAIESNGNGAHELGSPQKSLPEPD
jgi:hypothetical protein